MPRKPRMRSGTSPAYEAVRSAFLDDVVPSHFPATPSFRRHVIDLCNSSTLEGIMANASQHRITSVISTMSGAFGADDAAVECVRRYRPAPAPRPTPPTAGPHLAGPPPIRRQNAVPNVAEGRPPRRMNALERRRRRDGPPRMDALQMARRVSHHEEHLQPIARSLFQALPSGRGQKIHPPKISAKTLGAGMCLTGSDKKTWFKVVGNQWRRIK